MTASIESKKIDILGQEENGKLKKLIGKKDSNLDSEDWDEVCMLEFLFRYK